MNLDKLKYWQDRFGKAKAAYEDEILDMDARERLYKGDTKIKDLVRCDTTKETRHVRNICAELIEAQVDSNIPSPKVEPLHQEDEELAKTIEYMLRAEMKRLPMNLINDQMGRTVPIQGGAGFLLEWDETGKHGELVLTGLHPSMIVPQPGVYSGIEDMDYIFLMIPQTKEYILHNYGVDVENEVEEEPNVKGDEELSEDMVTQIMAYYRNDKGGIGLYSWVRDSVLCDWEDFQARRQKVCKACGRGKTEEVCPECGGTEFVDGPKDFETIEAPITTRMGTEIEGPNIEPMVAGIAEEPRKEQIPYYKPNRYPVILQKNTSLHGSFLGSSDLDQIFSQQNTTNRLSQKIIDKLLSAGSYLATKNDATIQQNPGEFKRIVVDNPADLATTKVLDMEGNIGQDLEYLEHIYTEARQTIGITDSFQGRQDVTATSGKAKEIAAQQSAGRLESKRVMKQAAYADLFKAMFQFKLAYSNEPMVFPVENDMGDTEYREFNRYDFLRKTEAGEWEYNDEFLFECDSSAPLASNREAMWQENLQFLQMGAFGDPTDPRVLISLWTKMARLHYPGAKETRDELKQRMRQMEQEQQMVQMQARSNAMRDAGMQQQELMQLDEIARSNAMRDAGVSAQ